MHALSADSLETPLPPARSGGDAPRVCVIGGAPDTGNLGVSALGTSAIAQLLSAVPSARVLWQHHSVDGRSSAVFGDALSSQVEAIFFHHSKRLRDRRGTRHLALLGKVLRHVPSTLRDPMLPRKSAIARLLSCSLVADISGGDSFADLYGEKVFQGQVALKRLALDLDLPLVMLPQTYGPFHRPESREIVRRILRHASLVATRDLGGLQELAELAGDRATDRFVECPDVAFTLPACPPKAGAEPFVQQSIERGELLVGVNVSGLAYYEGARFGLSLDYRALMARLVETAVRRWNARVLLVPHVNQTEKMRLRDGTAEDDVEACKELLRDLGSSMGDRVAVLDRPYSATEIKWVIGHCSFFIGARMHACIAAVSQGIPSAVQAYSKKAQGVMALAGAGETVVDLRHRSLEECLADTIDRFESRRELRKQLQRVMPATKRRVEEFFRDRVARLVAENAGCRSHGGS
jgi:colanic acid/amylovoran biosynthesis protein